MKTPEEAMHLIENMAASDHTILHNRVHIPTKKSLLELSSQDALLALNKLLSKKLEALTETLSKLPTQLHASQPLPSFVLQVTGCTLCGGGIEPREKIWLPSSQWASQDFFKLFHSRH